VVPVLSSVHQGAAREILRRRLEAQRLSRSTFTSPGDAVAWFGAVQAQDYYGALWAVGLRLARAHESDIERAVAERAIVRSWPMRGTLHFLAAADARWMIEFLAPRAARAASNRLRSLGIDAALLSKARRALVTELEGGRHLTRPEVSRVLERARIDTSRERGPMILWQLAHEGLLCFGARKGKQHTVVLFEEWLPRGKALRGAEALAEIARRYFASHGPATVRDLAWWSGMSLTEAGRAVATAGALLKPETIGGQAFWSVRAAAGPSSRSGPRAHALPPFDEFFVGYADRSAAIVPAQAQHLDPFDLLGPVIIHEGRLIASWKRRLVRGQVVCEVAARVAVTASRRAAMRRALARYAEFLQLNLEVEPR
jgi:hypothetical protein